MLPPSLSLPGSKSITNRVVTLAGMSRTPTLIKNFLLSDDTAVGLECLRTLGFDVRMGPAVKPRDPSMSSRGLTAGPINVLITPPHFKKLNAVKFYDQIFKLNMGNAGTMARFFPAVVLNWTKTFPDSPPIKAAFFANPQLAKRPILPLITALKNLGAQIENDTYPFKISSSDLSGFATINTEQSSQFLSGLLIAAGGAQNDIQIKRSSYIPQQDYVLITIDVLKKFHAYISYSNDLKDFTLSSTHKLFCKEFFIEPDASTACYFLSLAFLHNFSLVIKGIGKQSLQPDILFCDFLQKMGAKITQKEHQITIYKRADTTIKGGFSYDFSLMSDQALTAGVLALFAESKIKITGVKHIRYHESDRIACLVKNFQDHGFQIEENEDGFTVHPQSHKLKDTSGIWRTHDDHRFVMSGFLLNSVNSHIAIDNPLCVAKTAPTFLTDAKKLMQLIG